MAIGGIAGLQDYRERWADVKTPGDGSAYSVGTIEVHDTNGTLFSGADALPADTLPVFSLQAGPLVFDPARQIVIWQQADPSGTVINRQRYFYGTNPSDPTGATLRATNARAIAVWPGDTEADTRIVICGETFDEVLPRSNVPAPGWPGAGSLGSSGFIAVFDGTGVLRWSHHFFGVGDDRDCVISDVSIRVGDDGQGQLTDYVTFCGMSTYGNPAANATLTTVNPFSAPATCPNAASGSTDNGAGQWDGIVGRLRNAHASVGTPATVEYLSVLGGAEAEGLFGIADIDENRFAVVGCSGNGVGGGGNATLPVTFVANPGTDCPPVGVPLPSPIAPRVGVVAVFSMGPGALLLDSCETVGSRYLDTSTTLRDVLMQRHWDLGEPALIMVGATDDANVFTAGGLSPFPLQLGPQAGFGGGPSDGIILTACAVAGFPALAWKHGTYRGGSDLEHLTGVQGWNEYYDHFAVVGVGRGAVSEDFDVASYYRPRQSQGPTPLVLLTETSIGGDQNDRPAQMGAERAAEVFDGLATAATGGGIAVDPTARVNVVGTTTTNVFAGQSTWPITNPPDPQGRATTGSVGDAVRAALDLLPVGVGRTDGTGTTPINGPMGGYPISGYFGGTTPECALTPFGHRIGFDDPQAVPASPRILLDWEGDAPAPNANFALIVSRHPQQTVSPLSLLALQLGFPGADPAGPNPFEPVVVAPAGWFIWVPNNPVTIQAAANSAWEVMRFPLALPATPAAGTITLQVVCLLLQPIDGGVTVVSGPPGMATPACGQGFQSTFTASPGLWLDY